MTDISINRTLRPDGYIRHPDRRGSTALKKMRKKVMLKKKKNKCDIFSVVYIPLSLYYSSKERAFSALSLLLNTFLTKTSYFSSYLIKSLAGVGHGQALLTACGRDLDSVMLAEKIVSPIQTNAYTSCRVNIGHHSKFKKTGSIWASYCLLNIYNFNSYALSRFYDRHFFFIIWDPENVDKNLRQKHFTPFYSTIISPKANMHRHKLVEFDKVYQMI